MAVLTPMPRATVRTTVAENAGARNKERNAWRVMSPVYCQPIHARLGVPRFLLLRPHPQRLHLPVQIAALQAQQFRRARDIPVGLFELLENILALRRFAHFLQAAEAVQRPVGLAARGCSGMCRASTRTCGFRITMRSIRFFNSRTLPGQ